MEDAKIVQLYWDRNEEAIPVTADKYGSYCTTIANNILGNREDAEECVNDTYLKAWNSMPPHRPGVLSAFLGKIVRNLAFNQYKYNTAEKRGGSQTRVVLDEIAELVSDADNVEQEIDRKELVDAVDRFLDTLQEQERRVFLRRYWYLDSVSEICSRFGYSKSKVTTMLHRTRLKLRSRLEQEGLL